MYALIGLSKERPGEIGPSRVESSYGMGSARGAATNAALLAPNAFPQLLHPPKTLVRSEILVHVS
jgi:hypothetical protein